MKKDKLIVIPGFLSEKPSYNEVLDHHEIVDQIDPLRMFDARGWQHFITAFIQKHDLLLDVEIFYWPSHSLFNLLFNQLQILKKQWKSLSVIKDLSKSFLIQGAQQIHSIWTQSYQAAQAHSHILTEQCKDYTDQGYHVYVLGHSLGGMLLLESAVQWQSSGINLDKIQGSAWAPALAQQDLAIQQLTALQNPIEIFYSQHDLVLKYLFPIGQTTKITGIPFIDIPQILLTLATPKSEQQALGYIGCPSEYQAHQIDVSHLHIKHLDYLYHLPQLWSLSNVLPSP